MSGLASIENLWISVIGLPKSFAIDAPLNSQLPEMSGRLSSWFKLFILSSFSSKSGKLQNPLWCLETKKSSQVQNSRVILNSIWMRKRRCVFWCCSYAQSGCHLHILVEREVALHQRKKVIVSKYVLSPNNSTFKEWVCLTSLRSHALLVKEAACGARGPRFNASTLYFFLIGYEMTGKSWESADQKLFWGSALIKRKN